VSDVADIWEQCAGQITPGPLAGRLLRLVESQEQVATSRIVGSLSRQALLEDMLEAAKPAAIDSRLHYLLAAPFRYAPLAHGSRFGTRAERGIFYGALSERPLLAEAAYYRLVFWYGMRRPPPHRFLTQHTMFAARYRTRCGLRLQSPPFDRYHATLADPADYAATQALGRRMREAAVEAFEYVSARDRKGGINVALFTPRALVSRKPLNKREWLCETSGERVAFRARHSAGISEWRLEAFLVNGRLPQPAV
jgi:hypothetical protein